MVANTRDRNIDSSRREDSRVGTVDRCEVIRVYPHVAPLASVIRTLIPSTFSLLTGPMKMMAVCQLLRGQK